MAKAALLSSENTYHCGIIFKYEQANLSVEESGEEMADKFLVIDGSSLIHRAFFALPPLMTRQGVHTGAVYGFCNMLVKLLGDVKPKWLAVAFDKSRKTFRTELFADYKGQRKTTPRTISTGPAFAGSHEHYCFGNRRL